MDRAFDFVPLDPRRSLTKPRKSGITMVKEYQYSPDQLRALLEAAGDYIDIMKFVTGTARLFSRKTIAEKTALLRAHQVQPMLGGQFQEYVLHTMGVDAMPRHLDEAKALGFEIVEISDNVVELPDGLRHELMDRIRDLGMIPVGEIGEKTTNTSPRAIVDNVKLVLQEGSAFAMVEAQELMLDGKPHAELIELIRSEVDVTRCMFELSSPFVGSTYPEIFQGLKFLIKTFGPDVNLGNVQNDWVIITECARLGLGSAGPLAYL